MQPRTLVVILVTLPLLAANAAYLLSAYEGIVPWCMPYIDGCTSISRSARSGNAIFLFRATMIVYSVLLIWFWVYSKHWLNLLYGYTTKEAHIILWLGVVGAVSLIIYVDYLGTTGEVYRFMRRYGVMIYFTLTPLAQLLLLRQHFIITNIKPDVSIKPKALYYQLVIILLLLLIAIISNVLGMTHSKTDQTENIVEWNYSLLLTLYFIGMISIWRGFEHSFIDRAGSNR